jgi:hypothetical protein
LCGLLNRAGSLDGKNAEMGGEVKIMEEDESMGDQFLR